MKTISWIPAVLVTCAASWGQTVEWTYDLTTGGSAPTLFPTAEHPAGVVITDGQKVLLLKGDGSVAWQAKLARPAAGSPVTVADLDGDGSCELLVTLRQGTVCCLDAKGKPKWSRDYDTEVGGFKSVVAADVHPSPGLEVVFGFNDGWLRCLSSTGQTLWSFFGDRFRVGGVSVGDADRDGAPEVVYGTDNGHLYCLNGWGEVEWRYNELAPYGRSGTNLADLDNDGVPEVLVTRSNVNNNTCLIAVDGIRGALMWRTRDVMQGYVSNATVDLDGDGKYEVIHGDKGNNVYADNADGSRRWHAALSGRGVFWAPAVADVDGDGQLEIVTPLRGKSPETGASSYVLGADGTVEAELKIGGGTNAGPAVGDIDGDGKLEVILVSQNPNKVHCLTWNAAGRVAWPSLRGDSRMTARAANVPAGTPVEPQTPVLRGDMTVETGDVVWGENTWRVSWDRPAPEGAFVELTVIAKDGTRSGRIVDLKAGATEATVKWGLARPDAVTVSLRLWSPSTRKPLLVAKREVKARAPAFCRFAELQVGYRRAVEAGDAVGADTSGIVEKMRRLTAARDSIADLASTGARNETLAEQATTLRTHARELRAMTQALGAFWSRGGKDVFVCWEDANPWDRFDPADIPGDAKFDTIPPITFTAYGNEFEDRAVTIFNTTSRPIDVRCVFRKPDMGQKWYKPEAPLAGKITLRRHVPVPAQWTERVFDALPELDRSRSITIPPGEARQVWLVLKTHDLKPGMHELTLYLGSLTKPPTVREVPIRIQVWPVALPTDVYAKMNWTRIDPRTASDQGVQDLVDHGMSVSYGPALPAVPVDANGQLAGAVDWTAFDAVIDRVPRPWTFLWGGPPARRWPKGVKPAEDSPAYFNGFKTAIAELAKHLKSKGVDYHHWAFYPIDEPWNTGFTHIPHLKRFCERVKRADPKAQVYTDPAGLVRVEYLAEFKDLIDIWQPEINTLKRDPKLVAWFRKHAKRFWYYEAPGPAKDFLPLGHYRAHGWYAWHFGAEGSGYWIYKALDIWWPIQGGNWSAVYQTNTDVVPSRRWEADRDGVEDYRALYVLDQEIKRARAAGHRAEADQARALIDEAVEAIVGWNLRNIDEITRMTRDYEIDYELFAKYRARIAKQIMQLRETTSRPAQPALRKTSQPAQSSLRG